MSKRMRVLPGGLLFSKDGMLGLISLGPRLGDPPFSREDKRLLMSVGGPATFAIENAQLVEQMLEEARRRQELEAENEQRAKELEEARQLQLSMPPKNMPQLPHLEIAAYMKPAAEVGGDYYDFHQSDNGILTVVVSAGMPPVLIYRAETGLVEEVMIKAMPLGSVSGYPYRERELTLGSGDVVVLMSDGLPERFNYDGEMFDYWRTMKTLSESAARSSREIIEGLVSAGEAWAEGRPQDDDVTFVVLKVKS